MPITTEKIEKKLAQFKNENDEITLQALQRLDKIRQRAGSVEIWLETDFVDQPTRIVGEVAEDIDAAWERAREKYEALDRKADKYFESQAETVRASLSAGLPTGAQERLLYETVRDRLHGELEPLFENAGNTVAGQELVRRYERLQVTADEITIRAAYDAIQTLWDQYQPGFIGINPESLREDPDPSTASERRGAEAALEALQDAQGRWESWTRRRDQQREMAANQFMQNPNQDVVGLFVNKSRSPLNNYAEGMTDTMQLQLDEATRAKHVGK